MKKRCCAWLLAAALCALSLAGCGGAAETGAQSAAQSEDCTLLDADYTVDLENAVRITLSDGGSAVDGTGASVAGDTVTVKSGGTYLISGTLGAGQLVVDAGEDTVVLALSGVTLSGAKEAAILISQAALTVLYLPQGSENTVTAGPASEEESAAIYSHDDLLLDGPGSLTITDASNNAIQSADSLAVFAGELTAEAANNALKGKDSVEITGGTLTLTSTGGDCIQSDNDTEAGRGFVHIYDGSFVLTAACDGVQAETMLTIEGGSFTIETGGGSTEPPTTGGFDFGGKGFGAADGETAATPPDGSTEPPTNAPDNAEEPPAAGGSDDTTETTSGSYKALKAGGLLTITGGEFTIDSLDDAIHSNADVSVTGGTFTIATSDDGVHADGSLTLDGCTMTVSRSYEGLEGKNITINGGSYDITASDDGVNVNGGDGSGFMGGFGRDTFGGKSGETAADAAAADTSDAADSAEHYCLTITGGTLTVNASGDGLDSNEDILITGGVVYINGPADSANGALDHAGTFEITGGVLLALGNGGMVENPSEGSAQNSVAANFSDSAAGSTVSFTCGGTTYSLRAEKAYNWALLSAPEVTDGSEWTLSVDGETVESVTSDGYLTTVGTASFGMGGGNRPGGTLPDGAQPPDDTTRPERPDGKNGGSAQGDSADGT